ncbi:hypothetical protein AMECASPLE_012062 [Ameca splendens]|uniref:Uncharacterized protein n=1 Tax=Ameca splendens TaxID=208324 RepID=A0ABV0Y118_9TELE
MPSIFHQASFCLNYCIHAKLTSSLFSAFPSLCITCYPPQLAAATCTTQLAASTCTFIKVHISSSSFQVNSCSIYSICTKVLTVIVIAKFSLDFQCQLQPLATPSVLPPTDILCAASIHPSSAAPRDTPIAAFSAVIISFFWCASSSSILFKSIMSIVPGAILSILILTIISHDTPVINLFMTERCPYSSTQVST